MEQEQNKPTVQYVSNPFLVIFRGFDKLFKTNQTWAIIIIVVGLFGVFGNSFNTPFSAAGSTSATSESVSASVLAIVIAAVLLFIGLVVVITTFYRGAVAYVAMNTIQGRKVGFKEALSATRGKFWTIMVIQIVVGLKILGGLFLFIIPGIRAMLRYNMVYLPVFTNDKNAKESIDEMKTLTKGHLLEIFGMEVASGIIPIVGPALGVGGQIVMYPQLSELKSSGGPKPSVHWLNYIGLIIGGGFVLMMVLLLVILSALLH